ncbi:MAG: HlyD family efflux transporter periplasmic adaptor subunit [Planctomycetota bacterium]|jgi:multidrug resistance efflux pump
MMNQKRDDKLRGFERMDASDLLDRLGRFDENPSQFLVNLLTAQCFLGRADGGAILCGSRTGRMDILAMYPLLERPTGVPAWLTEAVALLQEQTIDSVVVKPLELSSDQEVCAHIIMIPLKMAEIENATVIFRIETDDKAVLEEKSQKLQLIVGMLNYSETRFGQLVGQERLGRLQQAMEILSMVNQQDKFVSAAMTLCNEVAAKWRCERVSIGFLKGRYVQLKAMSHTEDYSRKMQVVVDIESAMEECLDQDVEILFPAEQEVTYISRAAAKLSQDYGGQVVLSVPLRRDGECIAVLTLERLADMAFSSDEIETIRLTCELCSARLKNLYEYNRWVGATIAVKSRRFFAQFLGPTHTMAKVVAILCFAAVLFLIFAKGQFRPKAPFVLETIEQQVVPAPFDGYLKSVEVEIGQEIQGGTSVLASLDTADMRLQLAAAKAEKAGYLKEAAAAMRDRETATAQIAEANADKIQAQIDLLEYYISRANLISPISGIVVKGDLKRQIGAPVKTGDLLFEVCPIESMRAQLMVPEDLIFDIKVGQEGRLATASYPDKPIKFVVERINPAAEVVNQRNIFKVRVRLLETYPWMRPGMEGVAKISVGKRRYVWIWTRKIINWIRMKLWL